jgi:hypothetical protein
MRTLLSIFCLALATAPAAAQAQTHARHTAAHDSAHAIVLSDADHLALHQFLLGRWTGAAGLHGTAHDTLQVGFENDSSHQQLMVRHRGGLAGFEIRGDTLRWKQEVSGTACVASTAVSALLQTVKAAKTNPAQINGMVTCGKSQSPFTLRKIGT